MKISEVTNKDIGEYLRIDDLDIKEEATIEAIKRAAIAYIKEYTSCTEEELDEYEDVYIVVYILCQDMYDNRTLYVEGKELNRTVETILNMHRKSLIG